MNYKYARLLADEAESMSTDTLANANQAMAKV